MRQQLGFLDRDKTLHNVFFAVLPDAATATCAKTIARNVHRRFGLTATPISSERLHVSLLAVGGFSGSCPPSVIDAAMTAADTVSMASFRVAFDRVASFSGGHGKRALVLTGNGDSVVGFVKLQDALKHAILKVGLRLPQQSGSSPHLTMMYDDRACDCPVEPVIWTASRFVLVDSLVGQSKHIHLGQWYL